MYLAPATAGRGQFVTEEEIQLREYPYHKNRHWDALALTSPRLPDSLTFDTLVVLNDGLMMIMMILDAVKNSDSGCH